MVLFFPGYIQLPGCKWQESELKEVIDLPGKYDRRKEGKEELKANTRK